MLDAKHELVDSRIVLAGPLRDSVIASYLLLGAICKLTAADLRLPASIYNPPVHYDATRDRWYGTSTEIRRIMSPLAAAS